MTETEKPVRKSAETSTPLSRPEIVRSVFSQIVEAVIEGKSEVRIHLKKDLRQRLEEAGKIKEKMRKRLKKTGKGIEIVFPPIEEKIEKQGEHGYNARVSFYRESINQVLDQFGFSSDELYSSVYERRKVFHEVMEYIERSYRVSPSTTEKQKLSNEEAAGFLERWSSGRVERELRMIFGAYLDTWDLHEEGVKLLISIIESETSKKHFHSFNDNSASWRAFLSIKDMARAVADSEVGRVGGFRFDEFLETASEIIRDIEKRRKRGEEGQDKDRHHEAKKLEEAYKKRMKKRKR